MSPTKGFALALLLTFPAQAGEVGSPRLKPCREMPRARVDGEVRVRLLYGEGVKEATARRALDALRAHFAAYGLEVVLRGPPERVAMRAAVKASELDLARALAAAGIDSTRPLDEKERERAVRIALHLALEPVFVLLMAQGPPRPRVVTLVVLDEVGARGSSLEGVFSDANGLTLSPALLAALDPRHPVAAALREKGLASFVPTVFLSDDALVRPPGAEGTVPAHELGHALGLVHVGDPKNLMAPEPLRSCLPVLDEEQIRTLRAALR